MATDTPEAIMKSAFGRIFRSESQAPKKPVRRYQKQIDELLDPSSKPISSRETAPPVASTIGNGGKFRLPNFTKEFEVEKKASDGLKFLGWIALAVIVLTVYTVYDDWDQGRRIRWQKEKDAAAVLHAEQMQKIEEMNKKKESPPVQVAQAGFDCFSEASKSNRYDNNPASSAVHPISSWKKVTGCMWVEPDTRVFSVTGEGFQLEIANPANPGVSYKCTQAESYRCAGFVNEIRESANFPDKKFRILVRQGGYVNIS